MTLTRTDIAVHLAGVAFTAFVLALTFPGPL
jgi:hypothetical protein